jgi:protein-tyrosine phosphatase
MRAELYVIPGPWPGRLAILPRPRGGDWQEDEIDAWRRAGVDVVVSLLTPDEITDLELADEANVSRRKGMDFVSFPIPDRGVPSSAAAAAELVPKLDADLADGKAVAVHCRQGIGRSAVIAAGLLARAGLDPEAAFRRIGAARGLPVPETDEQRAWVEGFAREPLPRTPA